MLQLATFLALSLVQTIPAAARPRPSGAAPFATRLQHLVGQGQGEIRLVRVHAEGNMLIFTVNGGIGWRAFMPIAALSREQLIRFCRRRECAAYSTGGGRRVWTRLKWAGTAGRASRLAVVHSKGSET